MGHTCSWPQKWLEMVVKQPFVIRFIFETPSINLINTYNAMMQLFKAFEIDFVESVMLTKLGVLLF